jgi:hypothetical protein
MPMQREVASIRNNNPGAMWPGPSATKFGSTAKEKLKDKQRNQIAYFDDPVMGAADQFDLLSRAYVGLNIFDALEKWGGHNSAQAYTDVVCKRTGLNPDDTLTAKYLRNPKTGCAFAKAMAFHEAGKEFPLTTKQWKQAHELAFSGSVDVVADKDGSTFVIPAADGPLSGLGARIASLARSFEGECEVPGPGSNQNVTDWYKILGLEPQDDSKTPWCKLFATAMWKMGGAIVEEPDDELILLARNGLKQGTPVDVEEIDLGDYLIWPRGAYPQGHIGIVTSVDHEARRVTCHEGNVDNKVTRKVYTFAQISDRALGIRRPVLDKRRPNGTKSLKDTVNDSPSLKMLVWSKVMGLGAIVASFWDGITDTVEHAVGILPDAAEHVNSAVGSTQTIAQNAGVPLAAWAMFAMAAMLVVTVFARQWRQKSGKA